MDSEEDSDEIYDEIDRHHMSLDIPDDKEEAVVHRQEELLNVEGDTSDLEYEESDDDGNVTKAFSDSDSEEDASNNIEKFLPSADKWGSGRKSYYSTSYIDEDWGGMNDAEVELAELEEEDAIARQKKLDAALNLVSFSFQDDTEKEESASDLNNLPDISKMSAEEQFQYFLELNPDFSQIFDEYQEQRAYFLSTILPLLDLARTIKNIRQELILEKQLIFVVNVFSRYLINLLFAIHAAIASSREQEMFKLADHPVKEAIATYREEVSIVKHYVDKSKVFLQRLHEQIELNNSRGFLYTLPTLNVSQKIRKSSEKNELSVKGGSVETSSTQVKKEDYMEKEATKRLITNQMEKNKGLHSKRKKGTQHSRVKKRKQYKKALIKRRSQKADVKKELTPYGGERRGIRASTVKSVKLKA